MVEDVVTPVGPYRLRLMARSGTWRGALPDGRAATAHQRPDGRVVVALTRFDALGPRLGRLPFGFTSAEMARVMRALGCRDAILLDGGVSGQLMVREESGAARTWAGIRRVPLGLVARFK